MVYKTLLLVPESAHPALLTLGDQCYHVLLIAYIAAVGGIVIGFLLLAIAAARGLTLWPRWMALVINPISLALIGQAVPYATPEPLRTWLGGAGISIATLTLFAVSVWLTARKTRIAAHA
jgi:hypothetical protein